MKLALVGVGHAGSRIVNRILEVERETNRTFCHGNVLVFNTAPPEFETKVRIPDDRQVLIGDTHRDVDGKGVGGDPELAVDAATEDQYEILRAFDRIDISQVDGTLLAAGLGGGTGCGMGSVVLEELVGMYEKPVYAVGVLPAEDEGPDPAMNASRALQTFVPTADNVIGFDNDAWHGEDESEDSYVRTNRALADRVVTTLGAGEFDDMEVGENRIDPSDIIRTLDVGGMSSIGYATTTLDGYGSGVLSALRLKNLFSWLRNGTEDPDEHRSDASKIKRIVRRAVDSKLTLPCDVESTDRALIILSGPPEVISRKGFEGSRYWLEEAADTVEVLAGDEPRKGSGTLTAVVLLSNVTAVPRIEAMQKQAIAPRGAVATRDKFRDDDED